MKKILLLCLFSILSIFSFANDWEFGSEGEHIIPLKGSAVAIKKEKITLKLTEDGMLVNVKFTFDSPNAENKIIGFVTPESGNNEDYEENYSKAKRKAEPLKIKNYAFTCITFIEFVVPCINTLSPQVTTIISPFSTNFNLLAIVSAKIKNSSKVFGEAST